MKSFFVVTFTVAVILVAAANPITAGGSIRGSSVKILRRYLLDEDDNEEDNKCKDTPGQIQTGGGEEGNETLNCRKIKKKGLCEKKHAGKHLYESCQKSCDICEEEFDTTDAPTGDLLNLIVTEFPTEATYQSATPTLSPTKPFTTAPTESPSAYPTTQPTTLAPTVIALLAVTDEPTIDVLTNLDIELEMELELEVYESATPTLSPITPFTDTPTESPSRYPTVSPTVDMLAGMFEELDGDVLLGNT